MGKPMVTPKEMGKLAKRNGINAPTLDEDLSRWLARFETEKKLIIMYSGGRVGTRRWMKALHSKM